MPPSKSKPSPAFGRVIAFTQDACLQHRNISSGGPKNSLERPERLQAVNVGLGAIYARLEEVASARQTDTKIKTRRSTKSDSKPSHPIAPFTIVRSTASLGEIPLHPAARDVLHIKTEEDEERELTYAETLELWCKESRQKIANGRRELPDHFEADLYLCPKSFDAIKGALGTICEAVDSVAATSRSLGTRAFVAIRPPGHHCVADAPAGLGFVNNLMVGAVHAFYQHNYTHIVIFDIDLHHGNGTQQIVQQINEQRMSTDADNDNRPIMFFGSVHDINAYPCSEQRPGSTNAALLCRTGEHGQWIENAMMVPYTSDVDFWKAYDERYRRIIVQAERFVEETKASPDKVLVLMSCGFAASKHEDPTMCLPARRVPTSFYARFTRDAAAFADRVAQGRLVSVLEGGYSNHALISGVMAHMAGLVGDFNETQDDWWDIDRLIEAEKLLKKQPGRKTKPEALPGWLARAKQVVNCLNEPLDVKEDSLVLDIPASNSILKQADHPLSLSVQLPKAGSSKRAADTMSPAQNTKRAKRDTTPPRTTPRTTEGASTQSTEETTSARRVISLGMASAPSSSTLVSVSASQQSKASTSATVAESSMSPVASAIQGAYAEVSTCLATIQTLIDPGLSASPKPNSVPAPVLSTVTRAIRPLRGCIGRLERVLTDRTALLEVLAVLEKLLEEAHRACEPLKGELETVDRAMYDLEGAVLDLKNICSDENA